MINDRNDSVIPEKNSASCSGYCSKCNKIHTLPYGTAREKAVWLLRRLEQNGSIELFSDRSITENCPAFSTEPLFSDERGKMFGVLECINSSGKTVWLYGYSGQFNTQWLIPGWVPPLFDVNHFHTIHDPVEARIKALGREIISLPEGTKQRDRLVQKRKRLSQNLMRDIHKLYHLHNCAGDKATLSEVLGTENGKPTGTGDCCGPKLLNYAAVSNLVPISLAEFFFGKENRSQSREHAQFYLPCEKCRPLLGFMLCGAEERRLDFGT